MGKVKVLEIGPGNFGKGGLSVIAWNWYQNIDHNKVQLDFISGILPSDDYIKDIVEHGGNFYHYSGKNFIQKQVKKISVIKKAVQDNHYDCVHIHAGFPLKIFVYYCIVKPLCPNIIIHSHSSKIDKGSERLMPLSAFLFYIKELLNGISRILLHNKKIIRLACSDLAAEWMFPSDLVLSRQYTVVKNGIEISKYIFNQQTREKVRTKLNLTDKFVIGHIGRFAYQKNHTFLIEVFKEVFQKNPNSVLLLIGNGDLKEEIKMKVHRLGLDEAVYFYGTTPNTNELYQAMDCFVFPSNFEGLGIVAIEAQAAGLKTLCADTIPREAQITELLEYMPLSVSVDLWAEKILSYNTGYKRKNMSAEIRKAGYDIVDSAKQLEELYLNLQKK